MHRPSVAKGPSLGAASSLCLWVRRGWPARQKGAVNWLKFSFDCVLYRRDCVSAVTQNGSAREAPRPTRAPACDDRDAACYVVALQTLNRHQRFGGVGQAVRSEDAAASPRGRVHDNPRRELPGPPEGSRKSNFPFPPAETSRLTALLVVETCRPSAVHAEWPFAQRRLPARPYVSVVFFDPTEESAPGCAQRCGVRLGVVERHLADVLRELRRPCKPARRSQGLKPLLNSLFFGKKNRPFAYRPRQHSGCNHARDSANIAC